MPLDDVDRLYLLWLQRTSLRAIGRREGIPFHDVRLRIIGKYGDCATNPRIMSFLRSYIEDYPFILQEPEEVLQLAEETLARKSSTMFFSTKTLKSYSRAQTPHEDGILEYLVEPTGDPMDEIEFVPQPTLWRLHFTWLACCWFLVDAAIASVLHQHQLAAEHLGSVSLLHRLLDRPALRLIYSLVRQQV